MLTAGIPLLDAAAVFSPAALDTHHSPARAAMMTVTADMGSSARDRPTTTTLKATPIMLPLLLLLASLLICCC